MLRRAHPWLVWLALGAAAACSGSGEGEPGDPNQPAGKVIELAGQVSAAREGAAVRPLAVGAEVFADDTVTTAADGSAVILLAHNRVRWSLGSDTSLRVDRSMAWKAKADEGGSAFDDQDEMATASAGRHTDREAGDTAATAQLPAGAAEAPPAQSAPAAPPDTVAEAESRDTGAEPAPPPMRRPAPTSTADRAVANKSSERSRMRLEQGAAIGATRGGGGGGGASGAPPAPAPDSPIGGVATAAAPTAPPAPAGNLVLGKLTVKGALTAAQVGGRLAHLGSGCRGTVAGKVLLSFDIDGAGKVSNVRLSGSSNVVAPVSSCLSAQARALSFPAAPGGATTKVQRDIQISLVR